MGFGLQFRDKAGTFTDVPLQDGTSARLHQQFEGPNREIVYDDLTIELVDTGNTWSSIFTQANLDPADTYPACYGFRVLRDGSPYWEGDLDYETVEPDADKARCTVRVLDPLKRCQKKNAAALERDYSSLAIVDGPKQSKTLTVNTVLDASGYSLVEGDVVTVGHYKPTWNSGQKLFQQDLTVLSVDSADAYSPTEFYQAGAVATYAGNRYRCIKEHSGQLPTNPLYWALITQHIITFKQKMKAHYQTGDVIFLKTAWLVNQTAGYLVGKLLDMVPGFDSGHRTVNYTASGGDDIVAVADFEGKNVGQALERLAYWVNAQGYTRLGSYYFVERSAAQDPSTIKTIDSLVVSGPVRPVSSDRYDQVVVKERENRYARKGLSPFGGKKLEEDLPFSKDHAHLQLVCDRLWTYWSPRRQSVPKVTVADDGTLWYLKQRVSYGGVEYFVTSVSIPLNDGADIELELLARYGTAAPTSGVEVDQEAEDEFDPPEPLNFEMTKDYSSMFNTLYPESKYPRVVTRREYIGESNGRKLYADIPYRFYEFHWDYPYDEVLSRVYRFEIAIWEDGKDREKPEMRMAVPPDLQTDGRYYARKYLKARNHLNQAHIWWADVLARYDNLKEGLPSDDDSSVSEATLDGGDDYVPAPPTIYGLSSYEQDKPGTKYVDCDLLVSLTWTAYTVDMVDIQVQDGTIDTTRQPFVVVPSAGADTITLKAKYRRGNTLTVKVRAKMGKSAWGSWSSSSTVVAGSSTGTAPSSSSPVPTVLKVHSGTYKTRIKLQLGGTTADKKAVTHFEVYTAPKSAAASPPPDSNPDWDTEPEQDVSIYTKRGKDTLWVIVQHRDLNDNGSLDKPQIALRAVNNQSDSTGTWLYLLGIFDGWIQMQIDPLSTGDLATYRFRPMATGGTTLSRQWRWSFGDGNGTPWEADASGYYKDHTYSLRPEPFMVTVKLEAKDSGDNRFEVSQVIQVGGVASDDSQLRKPASVTSAANAHSGATAIDNPANVASSSDADYASVNLAASAYSQDLKCVQYGLSSALIPGPGDAIPIGSIIRGLLASVELEASIADKIAWDKVQLTYAGAALGPAKVIGTRLAGSKATVTFGAFGDNWQSDLTATILRASTFGLLLAWQNTHTSAILVKIYNAHIRAWADDGT